jgi:hypothetical protein
VLTRWLRRGRRAIAAAVGVATRALILARPLVALRRILPWRVGARAILWTAVATAAAAAVARAPAAPAALLRRVARTLLRLVARRLLRLVARRLLRLVAWRLL